MSFQIRHPSDVNAAQKAAQGVIEKVGFAPEACHEIALAMTELATNLIKHAQGGTLTCRPLFENGRAGLELESCDAGPGFGDFEKALADGFSTAGSLGTGLGAINRLMDDLEVHTSAQGGARIVCRKWLRDFSPSAQGCPLDIGVATRPRHVNEPNGDAFVVKRWAHCALVGVIDGLGHGPLAHLAAETARHYVEKHFDLPLDQIFRGTDRACRGTRGVVMALTCFDWQRGRLRFASMGDIEARLFPPAESFRLVLRRGVLGMGARPVKVCENEWPPGALLVLHSDGLRTHWRAQDLPGFMERPAAQLARQLLVWLAREEEDDATVIVVRKEPS